MHRRRAFKAITSFQSVEFKHFVVLFFEMSSSEVETRTIEILLDICTCVCAFEAMKNSFLGLMNPPIRQKLFKVLLACA
jgi:hypothetical protein